MNTTEASKLKTSLPLPVQSAASSCSSQVMSSFLSALRGNKPKTFFFTPFFLKVWPCGGRSVAVAAARKEGACLPAPLQRTQEPKFTARLRSLLSILELWGMRWPSVPYSTEQLAATEKVVAKFLASGLSVNTSVTLQVSIGSSFDAVPVDLNYYQPCFYQ